MTFAFAGRDFNSTALLRPAALKEIVYQGRRCLELDVRREDGPARKPADRPWASWQDRVRADGYPSRFPYGTRARFKLWYWPLEGCDAPNPGDWLNIFEIHAIRAGRLGAAGPAKVTCDHSKGAGVGVDRIWQQALPPSIRLEHLIAANTAPEPLLLKTIRNTRELVLKQGDQHLFEVEFWIDDQDGYLIVRKNFDIVGGVFGGFGYGPADEYCLHWGIYRNSRTTRTVARMALEGWEFL